MKPLCGVGSGLCQCTLSHFQSKRLVLLLLLRANYSVNSISWWLNENASYVTHAVIGSVIALDLLFDGHLEAALYLQPSVCFWFHSDSFD